MVLMKEAILPVRPGFVNEFGRRERAGPA